MIFKDGSEIRWSDGLRPGKYGSAMAEFLHAESLNGLNAGELGNSTDGPGHVVHVGGRHVIVEDPNGFVDHHTMPRGADFPEWVAENYPDIGRWERTCDEWCADDCPDHEWNGYGEPNPFHVPQTED